VGEPARQGGEARYSPTRRHDVEVADLLDGGDVLRRQWRSNEWGWSVMFPAARAHEEGAQTWRNRHENGRWRGLTREGI
jgi:hypothetical protein